MKDESGTNHYSVPPFDESPAAEDWGLGDGTFSAQRSELLKEFRGATVTEQTLDEMIDSMAEKGMLSGAQAGSAPGSERKHAQLNAKLLKFAQYVKDHPNPVAIFAALHAWDVELFDDINHHQNQKEFADTIVVRREVVRNGRGRKKVHEIHLTKAAVNNAILDAQKYFQLPPRQDQRKSETRAKQSEVRKNQLIP